MAWRCPGDKPVSEPVMVSLLTLISVTRTQWVNNLRKMPLHILQLLTQHRWQHSVRHNSLISIRSGRTLLYILSFKKSRDVYLPNIYSRFTFTLRKRHHQAMFVQILNPNTKAHNKSFSPCDCQWRFVSLTFVQVMLCDLFGTKQSSKRTICCQLNPRELR